MGVGGGGLAELGHLGHLFTQVEAGGQPEAPRLHWDAGLMAAGELKRKGWGVGLGKREEARALDCSPFSQPQS